MRPAARALLSLCLAADGVLCRGKVSTEKTWYTRNLEPRSMRELSDEHKLMMRGYEVYDPHRKDIVREDLLMANVATLNCKKCSPRLDSGFVERITALVTEQDLRVLCLQNISCENTERICESLNSAALVHDGKQNVYKYRHSHTEHVDEAWKDKKYPRLATIYNSSHLVCLDARMSYMHHDELTVSLKSSMEGLRGQGYSNVMGDQSPSMVCTFSIGFSYFLPWIRIANVCTKIDTYNSLRLCGLRRRFEADRDWPADRFRMSDLLYTNLGFKRLLLALNNRTIRQSGSTRIISFIVGDFGVNAEKLEASPVQKIFDTGYVHMFMPMNRFSSVEKSEDLAFFKCGAFSNAYCFDRNVRDASSPAKQKAFERLTGLMEETSFIFHSSSSKTEAVYIEGSSHRGDTLLGPVFSLKAASVFIKYTGDNYANNVGVFPQRTTSNCRRMSISKDQLKSPSQLTGLESLDSLDIMLHMSAPREKGPAPSDED